MHLKHDFSELWKIAEDLGAKQQSITLHRAGSISAIEAELIRGREIRLDELESVSGLLAFAGRQVLLYIPDQGSRITEVLQGNAEAGRRFHVAHCETLEDMKQRNRYERYIATTDLSGTFEIHGRDKIMRHTQSGRAKLYVCQNCLKTLNYKQAALPGRARNIMFAFELKEFFDKYSSHFKYAPSCT